MTTALYRRYRPETFAEMIGQSQVTDPLMTALRGDRVGHAYLFSGPRGCGKTTSARILARCLNCAEGPTDTPCGTCPSCVELSRAGGGSLDVVEIDAASHNGVDDARDLRERATFAPSRDRYKIFILDEAHMVTAQGFNALLKLVEEPPAHVKFIFATTEPEKVLGTIRSRTHHYPFRLVPPAAMLEYVERLCAEENVTVDTGVLPLVVRAGGGSPRDTLSLLDQLIAGSEESDAGDGGIAVRYDRAVALLGYTPSSLLDEIVEALAGNDASAVFPAIDRIVQTGQDPRRFVDDLLERLRDLIVLAAVGDRASSVLRGVPEDELARMHTQAQLFGRDRLSRTADIVSLALDDMSGATSPRLHLELMIARVLAAEPASTSEAPSSSPAPAAAASAPASRQQSPAAAPAPVPEPASASEPAQVPEPASAPEPAQVPEPVPAPAQKPAPAPATASAAESKPEPAASGPVTIDTVHAAWQSVLGRLEQISRASWLVATGVEPLAYDTGEAILTLGFHSPSDVERFRGASVAEGPSEHLRQAIEAELGVRVKYRPAPLPARTENVATQQSSTQPPTTPPSSGSPSAASPSAASRDATPPNAAQSTPAQQAPTVQSAPQPRPSASAAAPVTDWAVASIPSSEPASPSTPDNSLPATPDATRSPAPASAPASLPVDDEPADAEAMPASGWYQPPTDGEVSDDEPPPYDDEPPYPDDDRYATPPAAPAQASDSAASGTPSAVAPAQAVPTQAAPVQAPAAAARRSSAGGVQRYGEAVIRQVLGATFVREEPYEPPARFS
ncbi:DNA polymerase III subunit gamma and tau [Microbacterium sp. YY-01]|uniref:DNA polymerase III subunit gamma and tau n=1 Tax=Microbacterium sp. YY-01 TaxID=3421634 RepID=UPI003D17CE5B